MKTTLRDWQARPFMPHADMQGEYCKLTPLCPGAHGGELWDAFAADKRGMDWRYLPYGPFADKRAFMKWLRLITGGIDPQFYAILDNDGAAVGMASYLNIVPLHGVVEVGHIHYAPCLQRTAAATETMFLMMRRAFAEVGYRRYEWKCDSRNRRSCAAALRLGFRAEGIFRQHQVNKGQNRDSAWFSITDKEYCLQHTIAALQHLQLVCINVIIAKMITLCANPKLAMQKWLAAIKNGKQQISLSKLTNQN